MASVAKDHSHGITSGSREGQLQGVLAFPRGPCRGHIVHFDFFSM